LFNFVDTLSQWDYFVGQHIRQYYKENYNLDENDKKQLKEYAKIRKKIDWEKEIALFNWAYDGFTPHTEFSTLESTLKHFETKTSKNGQTLKLELEEATQQITDIAKDIQQRFNEQQIEKTIRDFAVLFNSPLSNEPLPCYLTYSPFDESTQGGANGDGIYAQVSTSLQRDNQVQITIETVAHEYMHKVLNPGRYFKEHSDDAKRKMYNTKFPEIYPDELYQFVEEVIVHSINDVLTFGIDPIEERDYYDGAYKDDEERRKQVVTLWQAISDVSKILGEFKDGKIGEEEVKERMERYWEETIKPNNSENTPI